MIRPFAAQVIENLADIFEVAIFTASHSTYANSVIDLLDPTQKNISFRLFRENCVETKDGVHIKDIRVIRNRNIKEILIVDNSLYCYGFHLQHGIPIIPFYSDPEDRELIELEMYMKKLVKCENPIKFNQEYFCYSQLAEHSSKIEMLKKGVLSRMPFVKKLYVNKLH